MAHAHHHDPNRPGHPSKPAYLEGDELDIYPAGAEDSHHHHGHTIVSPITLIGVLGVLLALTLLTVATSQAEGIIAAMFNFVIPQWINVAVALSIAAVKTALVVLFFMQLKYDNPINSMVFIFTLITVVFFLGFTMTDLGGRGSVYRYKAEYVTPGGIGLGLTGTPHTEAVAALASNPEHPLHKAWLKAQHAHDGVIPSGAVGFPTPDGITRGSTPWQSRPITVVTLPGFAAEAPHDDHHPAPRPQDAPPPRDLPDDAQRTGG